MLTNDLIKAADQPGLISCVLCGSRRYLSAQVIGSLSLVRCADCSLIRLDVPEDLSAYVDRMEANFFGHDAVASKGLFTRWFSIYQAKRRLSAIQKYKRQGELLEIGSGTGEFLYLSDRVGFRSTGIELSESMADYARRHYHVRVYSKPVEQIDFDRKFDAIVMCHVLEHLQDPVHVLRGLQRNMKADGLLYIAVPNADCWEARFSGWISYEPYHLFYFSPAALRRALTAAGYQVLRVSTWESFSGWFNTLLRTGLAARYASARAAVGGSSGRAGFKQSVVLGGLNMSRLIFGGLTVPLRWAQMRWGRGEELIAMAKPRTAA